jgi:LytS/YehU family sensor histidine kinase
MNFLEKYSAYKLLAMSLLGATLIVYPDIACLPWELSFIDDAEHGSLIRYFIFRYLFFIVLTWIMMYGNLQKMDSFTFRKRLLYNVAVCAIAYVAFIAIALSIFHKRDCFGSLVLFQFLIACLLSTFIGYISQLNSIQHAKQQEIERLKTENLQSRCDALSNQLNPHFFFNSLNGLTALIRRKDDSSALTYINKMSDIFRYILQSDGRGVCPLKDELSFVQSFIYMLEVRFADKLVFDVNVPEDKQSLLLPPLSLLPLIDNIVVHNTIDSQHKMIVSICVNADNELIITHPIYPKLALPDTNGTGLKNLENRFSLLMGKHIRIAHNSETYTVYLPLTNNR